MRLMVGGVRNERGVALPMAMMMLLLLSSLMIAFAVLSQTEPVIANNQLRVAQARAFAETGFERAVWALTNSTNADGLASPLPAPVPAPYDGGTFVASGASTVGGFVVTVTNAPTYTSGGQTFSSLTAREIVSQGWTPTNSATDGRTKGRRQIRGIVEIAPNLGIEAPCALCVKGDLSLGGNTLIDGTNTSSGCGGNTKYGTYTSGNTTVGGSASVTGGAGATCTGTTGCASASEFDKFTFTSSQLNYLKDLARKNGTYFGPGYPNGGTTHDGSATWSGSVTFNSGNQVKNGIVFVDTTDGTNWDPANPQPSKLASVDIHGNPFVSGDFTGWFIVNGRLSISGNMQMNGLVYVVNDLSYNGTGTGAIRGLAVSQNVYDTAATTIDSDTTGNSRIIFDCNAVSDNSGGATGYSLVTGTYQEQSN
jgi:hypothetical protein